MKKILKILLIFIAFNTTNVFANSVDYKLEITEDGKFNEEVTYNIENYYEVENGDTGFTNKFLEIHTLIFIIQKNIQKMLNKR